MAALELQNSWVAAAGAGSLARSANTGPWRRLLMVPSHRMAPGGRDGCPNRWSRPCRQCGMDGVTEGGTSAPRISMCCYARHRHRPGQSGRAMCAARVPKRFLAQHPAVCIGQGWQKQCGWRPLRECLTPELPAKCSFPQTQLSGSPGAEPDPPAPTVVWVCGVLLVKPPFWCSTVGRQCFCGMPICWTGSATARLHDIKMQHATRIGESGLLSCVPRLVMCRSFPAGRQQGSPWVRGAPHKTRSSW